MTDWTSIGDAPRLLLSCAQNPPRQATWRTRSGDRNDGVYVGVRVRLLREIWRAEDERLFKLADESGNYRDWQAHRALSVQAALADLIKQSQDARSLGGDVEKDVKCAA